MYKLFHYQTKCIILLLGLFVLGWIVPGDCQAEAKYVEIFSYSYTIPPNLQNIKDSNVRDQKEKNPSLSKIIIYCVLRGTQSYGIRLGSTGGPKLEEWFDKKPDDYKNFRDILLEESNDERLQQAIEIENPDGKWGANSWYTFREFLISKLNGKESEIISFSNLFTAKVIDLNKFIGNTPSGKKAELKNVLETGISQQLLCPQFAKKVKKLYDSFSSELARINLEQNIQGTSTPKTEVKKFNPVQIFLIIVVIVIIVIFLVVVFLHRSSKQVNRRVEELKQLIREELNGRVIELVNKLRSKDYQVPEKDISFPGWHKKEIKEKLNVLHDDFQLVKAEVEMLEDIVKKIDCQMFIPDSPTQRDLPTWKRFLQIQSDKVNKLEVEKENLEKRINYLDSTIKKLPSKTYGTDEISVSFSSPMSAPPGREKDTWETDGRVSGKEREDVKHGVTTPPEPSLKEQISSLSVRLDQQVNQLMEMRLSIHRLEGDNKERESLGKIQADIRTSQIFFKNEMEKELTQTKNSLNSRFDNIVSEAKQDRTELSGLTEIVFKLEDSIKQDKKSLESLDSLKQWYEDLEDEAYKEYIIMYAPTEEKGIISDDLTSKMENILRIVNNLNTKNFEGNAKILKAVKDFEENIKGRLNILKGKGGRPVIKKEIQGFDEYKKEQAKQLALLLISEEEANRDLDIEKKYRGYVEDEYKKYLRKFIVELKEMGSEVSKSDKNRRLQYDEFIKKDLNLFLDIIDRIKDIPSEVKNSLNEIFDEVGIEEIPIEIGKTKAHSSIHKIGGVKSTQYEEGTVVEVIFRGLRYKNNKSEIRKPVVIIGERR